MARYQLFSHPEGRGYLLDVQSDLIDIMSTRAVVPLLPASETPAPISRLHPTFTIGDQKYLMATHLIAAVPTTLLDQPRGSLADHHYTIVSALDMLFQGF